MKRWVSAGMAALVMASGGVGLLACGDTIVNTTNVYADGGGDGGSADADRNPGDGMQRDARAETDADVVDGGEDAACAALDAVPVSDECTVLGPCTGCAGAKEAYACEESDGGTRPDIEGCESRGIDSQGRNTWCCPTLTCVRSERAGKLCDGHGYVCPLLPGTSNSMAPQDVPGWQCDLRLNGSAQGIWCCHLPLPPMTP